MSDIEDVSLPEVIIKGSQKGRVNTKDNKVFAVEFSRELARLTRKDEDEYKSVTTEKRNAAYKSIVQFFEDRSTQKINFYQEEVHTPAFSSI